MFERRAQDKSVDLIWISKCRRDLGEHATCTREVFGLCIKRRRGRYSTSKIPLRQCDVSNEDVAQGTVRAKHSFVNAIVCDFNQISHTVQLTTAATKGHVQE